MTRKIDVVLQGTDVNTGYIHLPRYSTLHQSLRGVDQSIFADVSLFGRWRLLDRRMLVFLNFACFRSFLRATMTGTEDFVTR